MIINFVVVIYSHIITYGHIYSHVIILMVVVKIMIAIEIQILWHDYTWTVVISYPNHENHVLA